MGLAVFRSASCRFVGALTGRSVTLSIPAHQSCLLITIGRCYATETRLASSGDHSAPPYAPSDAPQSNQSRAKAQESPDHSSSSFASSESSLRSSSQSSSATKPSTNPPTTSDEHAQETGSWSLPPGWEDEPTRRNLKFSELPHRNFGFNQHMIVNAEFKEALRQVLWQFRAPIRYAFTYGSGVFSQRKELASATSKSPHPNPPQAVKEWQKTGGKHIDFIFGVSHTQHWHSLNLQQHRDHYSFLGSLGSNVVTRVQEDFGAKGYFNAYVVVNGIMIKYGVVNLDTLFRDLQEWDTLYFAGRLHKPVKILRDDPRIRMANQKNLVSAVRTALLMLPPTFTEHQLYTKIASISYMGDPRMAFRAENPRKVADIVDNQMVNFRKLYLPLIDDLPNMSFNDPAIIKQDWIDMADINCKLEQDMDPQRRGNMVRRLPKAFRQKLYQAYQREFRLPLTEFQSFLQEANDESSYMGTDLDKRIAASNNISDVVANVVKQTINWPSLTQSFKGLLTAGLWKGMRYLGEKLEKGREKKLTKAINTEKKAGTEKATEQTVDAKKSSPKSE